MIYLRYILSRLIAAMPVLVAVTLFSFVAIKLVPGDPVRIMMRDRVSDAEVAAIYAKLGMDRPLVVQYLSFVKKAATGDLGQSIIQNQPVSALVSERIAPTLMLLCVGTIFSILIALPIGILAASRPDTVFDQVVRIICILGFAMPHFWVGLLLMLAFGIQLRLLPISGYGANFPEHLAHMILPGLTIALFLGPVLIRTLRASMIEVLTTDQIEVARARGLPSWRILGKHALRNALIPTLTVLAVNISWLVSGAVVIESVFALPGLGSLLIQAVSFRDYPLIQGLSVVLAVTTVGINLIADLSYALVDRRVLRD
ncbi:ABC transporter permease subunit [Rhizobium lusitanum]|uniref:ABC transporter permease subunit n=1 Tax=Rhizobium lusitanum TaxID=293958 RepID=A0A6L9U791_9HYPH|nr:ABC transporter permease [Rhizobium lusitanum]NEI71815.1 ABC transporter permease subunit [Rhizobium lusitanum]